MHTPTSPIWCTDSKYQANKLVHVSINAVTNALEWTPDNRFSTLN